jgi:hypothetical protein
MTLLTPQGLHVQKNLCPLSYMFFDSMQVLLEMFIDSITNEGDIASVKAIKS